MTADNPSDPQKPSPLAAELVSRLQRTNRRIVFAESCTGGLVAAELAKVPGVSEVFCGSSVTYRNESKIRWLGVDRETIDQLTAVSAPVAHQMAIGILKGTPEANLAVAVTGHLGPSAPEGQDGYVLIATAQMVKGKHQVSVVEVQLTTSLRIERQSEAMESVLQVAIDAC